MEYEKFNQLQQDRQLGLLKTSAVLLVECRRFNLSLKLYQVEKFYVELYSNEETGEVVAINAFEDLNNLESYLEQIDISEVLR